MLTVIIKRTEEPKVTQLTLENVARDLNGIVGSEILLEDTWKQGIRKVRTPYFSLVEADCVLSASYYPSNVGLMKKASTGVGSYRGGGNVKLAMIASCLGLNTFDQRLYNYRLGRLDDAGDSVALTTWQCMPNRQKNHTTLYEAQIGFVPGAVIRFSSIKEIVDSFRWDDENLVRLSFDLCMYLWATNRRVNINPNTTYVSTNAHLETPRHWKLTIPAIAQNVFMHEGLA